MEDIKFKEERLDPSVLGNLPIGDERNWKEHVTIPFGVTHDVFFLSGFSNQDLAGLPRWQSGKVSACQCRR